MSSLCPRNALDCQCHVVGMNGCSRRVSRGVLGRSNYCVYQSSPQPLLCTETQSEAQLCVAGLERSPLPPQPPRDPNPHSISQFLLAPCRPAQHTNLITSFSSAPGCKRSLSLLTASNLHKNQQHCKICCKVISLPAFLLSGRNCRS